MGCGLPKVGGSGGDVIAPGRVHSTVKKAQIHHQEGVAYSYRFLDFLLGKEEVGVSSLPCLSSVREIPERIREWCGRDYELAAVHPFVHLCNAGQPLVRSCSSLESVNMYRSLHRAVLVKEINSSVKRQRCCLETDVCFYGNHLPSPAVIHSYMKKVQGHADKGAWLTGLLLQPGGGPYFPRHGNTEEDLTSLHSTPSPTHNQSELRQHQTNQSEIVSEVKWPPNTMQPDIHTTHTHHNNNEILRRPKDLGQTADSQSCVQLFALYKQTKNPIGSQRFYSITVPLKLKWEAGLMVGLDAHWLDHMNQHFLRGASLIDGFLCQLEDTAPSAGEGVFLFQVPADDSQESITPYDAIVVEQWTCIDGVAVKADYTPLLLSLAPFGWRLMCVLPTPIIRNNSDGSLATKQVLFLQRPVQLRRRRGQQKLHFRGLNRTKRNSHDYRGDSAETRQLMGPQGGEEEAEEETGEVEKKERCREVEKKEKEETPVKQKTDGREESDANRGGERRQKEREVRVPEMRRETDDRKDGMKREEDKEDKDTQIEERSGQSQHPQEGSEGRAIQEHQDVCGGSDGCTNREAPHGSEEEVRVGTTHALFSGVC
ncbi:raftlin [Engraulis encrasicolus]|uniref:raftlin n=1 Tax=Engraulis encrasicolus TaxID=184585 RepID=UPI002FD614A8